MEHHDDKDIFTAFTHLGPDSKPHEEESMPTLNSPVHPLLFAQTPGEFIQHNLPDLIHRYMRFWKTELCGKHELELTHGFEPAVQFLGRGSGETAREPLCCTALFTTTPLYLIVNNYVHNNYVHDAGARIWVDDPATAVVLRTTAVSGPFPELELSSTHEQTYVRSYEDWKNGRYGDGHAWTVDSASKWLSDSQSDALKGHFHRVIWKMVGPAEFTLNGIVKHEPSVLVEHGDKWLPSITIHVLTLYHGDNLNALIHFAIKFLSPHEPTRRSFTIAPHMLFKPQVTSKPTSSR